MKRVIHYIATFSLIVLSMIIISFLKAPISASASTKDLDLSKLDIGMQCAAVMNSAEYEGTLYFSYNNVLYGYNSSMAGKGVQPRVFLKSIDSEKPFMIHKGYFYYYTRETQNTLYRTKIGSDSKKRVSKGVYKIITVQDDRVYFKAKKYYYSVRTDGKDLKCIFKNKWNASPDDVSDIASDTMYIFNGKMFYSKGLRETNGPAERHDHMLCVMNLKDGTKKTLLDPDGVDSSFRFYELEGELYVRYSNYLKKAEVIYRYDAKKDSLVLVEGADKHFSHIIGTDGKYLYAAPDEYDVFYGSQEKGRADVYRIGKDWHQEFLFTINKEVSIYTPDLYFSDTNGIYYIFYYEDEEYPQRYCFDSSGNPVYRESDCFLTPGLCQIEAAVNDDGDPVPFLLDDDGMMICDVHMTIRNDELYVTCIGQGNTGGAKRVNLPKKLK